MPGQFLSSSWYRVAQLKPRLLRHVEVKCHVYRDKTWFVLFDASTNKTHRVTPAAYQLVSRMDGSQTVHEAWVSVCDELGEDAPSQDETIQILAQLGSADLLATQVAPDIAQVHQRARKQSLQKIQQLLL